MEFQVKCELSIFIILLFSHQPQKELLLLLICHMTLCMHVNNSSTINMFSFISTTPPLIASLTTTPCHHHHHHHHFNTTTTLNVTTTSGTTDLNVLTTTMTCHTTHHHQLGLVCPPGIFQWTQAHIWKYCGNFSKKGNI